MNQHVPDNQDKIWSYYQSTMPESFSGAKPRLDYILQRVSTRKKSSTCKILDIGVGDGYLEMRGHKLGWDVYALDPDAEAIGKLNKQGIKAQVGYIEHMPFEDNEFDFVVASEVLEHLSNEQLKQGIPEITRVLRDGGWFVGTVPYKDDLSASMVVCPACGEIFHRWGHLQSFDENAIRQLFLGKLVVKVADPKLFQSWRQLNWKGKITACLKRILFMLRIHGSNENLYFEARKVPRNR
jgi:SAM-dependent methyltransferase